MTQQDEGGIEDSPEWHTAAVRRFPRPSPLSSQIQHERQCERTPILSDFEIYIDPCNMPDGNAAAVAEFIKGTPPGEVPPKH